MELKKKSSADKLVDWLREAADEIHNAHVILDTMGVPRINPAPGGAEFTLAARIAYLGGVR